MSSDSKYLLIGLQNAGKTTFLAALWYLVQPHRHATALRLERLEGSSKYLNQIQKDWLEYKDIPRTHSASERVVSMRLQDQQSGRKMTLLFPDLAGESFEHQWKEREWTRDYRDQLSESGGGLLFVNPDAVKGGLRIDQADLVLEGLEPTSPQTNEKDEPSGKIPPWDKSRSPTQVQLVEILQYIRDYGACSKPFRIAVVVSAWDRVRKLNLTPRNWLKDRLPLLSQFLRANTASFQCEFFGVSAQGGAYAAPKRDVKYEEPINEPLSKIEPVKRIEVVGDTVVDRYDISAPLKWLMS